MLRMSRPRSQVKINFPPWYGNGCNPYRAHREIDQALTSNPGTCCCAGEGLFNTKLTGPGEVFLQSYSHGKFKNYAIEWYLGNRASAGLARFASRGGAAADPFGAPPAADTEVIQRRGNHAPAPVPAAAPMDRKGR